MSLSGLNVAYSFASHADKVRGQRTPNTVNPVMYEQKGMHTQVCLLRVCLRGCVTQRRPFESKQSQCNLGAKEEWAALHLFDWISSWTQMSDQFSWTPAANPPAPPQLLLLFLFLWLKSEFKLNCCEKQPLCRSETEATASFTGLATAGQPT